MAFFALKVMLIIETYVLMHMIYFLYIPGVYIIQVFA